MRKLKMNLCQCGCGQACHNRFVHGHHARIDNPMHRPEVIAKFRNKRNPFKLPEVRKILSEQKIGPNNPNWQGGISTAPYCFIWGDKKYKQMIKERDNNECQNPNCRKNCNHLSLELHHIDHDKMACNPKDIITVCKSCNVRANFNRIYWKSLYQNIMAEKYGYKYD